MKCTKFSIRAHNYEENSDIRILLLTHRHARAFIFVYLYLCFRCDDNSYSPLQFVIAHSNCRTRYSRRMNVLFVCVLNIISVLFFSLSYTVVGYVSSTLSLDLLLLNSSMSLKPKYFCVIKTFEMAHIRFDDRCHVHFPTFIIEFSLSFGAWYMHNSLKALCAACTHHILWLLRLLC